MYTIASTHAYNVPAGNPLAMRLDRNGRPRIVYYSGPLGGDPDNTLFYAWCNASCTSAASWGRSTAGLAAGNGDGADLAFDNANRPHIVYANGQTGTPPYSLGYGVCLANCESSSPTWQHVSLEDPLAIPPAVYDTL